MSVTSGTKGLWFPRTRGDRPTESPSAPRGCHRGSAARAGMDRRTASGMSSTPWFPRTRGDRPSPEIVPPSAPLARFPRTRGDRPHSIETATDVRRYRGSPARAGIDLVGPPARDMAASPGSPARAGIDPQPMGTIFPPGRFPRRAGIDPCRCDGATVRTVVPPHARG